MCRLVTVTAPLNKPTSYSKFAWNSLIEIPAMIRFLFSLVFIISILLASRLLVIVVTLELTFPIWWSLVVPVEWLPQWQVLHLIVCYSPASALVECHPMSECDIIFVYIVLWVGISSCVNDSYILPNFLWSMGIGSTVNGSIGSESLFTSPDTCNFWLSAGWH